MTLIFNASPLIVLAKADLLECLLPLANKVWIPQSVAEEVSHAKDTRDPASQWISRMSSHIHPPTMTSPFLMAWDLGPGETAVISLTASSSNGVAVLDDLAARRCAQAMGLRIVGTLGLILMAKRAGIIPSVSRALDAVVAAGLFISPHHLEAIRIQAGAA